MFIDSHCHIDFPELSDKTEQILSDMKTNKVDAALVVSVNLSLWPGLLKLVEQHNNLFASVGEHPGYEDSVNPTPEELLKLANSSDKVIAIGETGLDYFRLKEPLDWQRERFRQHIHASKESGLPLIIHTRAAREDTIKIMKEEGANSAGGVMHCFTENWEMAKAAMDMGFYISFSGILTFNSAKDIQEVAKKVPLDRILIETDSPYLSPVPFRGKTNDPSKVVYVAQKLADLRSESIEKIAEHTTNNFYTLFSKANRYKS